MIACLVPEPAVEGQSIDREVPLVVRDGTAVELDALC
jgi:hypothetical protein